MNDEIKNYIDDKLKEEFYKRRVNLFDIFGLFETVSTAPVGVPNTPYDQIKIYVNSTTYRLYWYDSTAGVWHYVTATA